MLGIELSTDDDPQFVEAVARLVAGALAVHQPQHGRAFQIDNWFDHKWLAFSGKTLGAVGVWRKGLTLPPFVANRIVRQWHWERDADGAYKPSAGGPDIHHRGDSAGNLRRYVRSIVPHTALFWFSGGSAASGRGCLMGYIPVREEDWAWYVSLVRVGGWKVDRRKHIHDYEVRSFERHADAGLQGHVQV